MKTFYITKKIRDPINGRWHHKGNVVQSDDPEIIDYFTKALEKKNPKIPVTRRGQVTAPVPEATDTDTPTKPET